MSELDIHSKKLRPSSPERRLGPCLAGRPCSTFGLLDELHLLELLERQSSDVAVTLVGVAGSEASVGAATVDNTHSADSHGALDVELSGNGGGSDVEPVIISRWHLLVGGGLGKVAPLGHVHLAGFLEERGKGGHEIGLVDVLDTHHDLVLAVFWISVSST